MPAGISQVLTSDVRHVPVLQFFDIGSPALDTRITVADFGNLMDWFHAQGYVPQKLSDYIRWMRGEMGLPKKSVVLTFWGALRAQYTQAFPKLRTLGFSFNLMIPCSLIEHEAQLASGIYFTPAQLEEMVASNLCEPHSEGYHLMWLFQGSPAAIQPIYKAAGVNLKWGGIQERVEDSWSSSPLIGTNGSLQPITSTYTFKCLPRGYRGGALTPLQVVAKYLVVDQLRVIGTPYFPSGPPVNIYAKKSTDLSYTLIKSDWYPHWSGDYCQLALDTPFTFKKGLTYNLKFVTQSAAGAAGELVALGSRTAQAEGVNTTCASNSSVPGFTNGQQIGADLYLLESLATENQDEVRARVKGDAQEALNFLALYQPVTQRETALAYPYNTYHASGLFLPSALRALHPLQMSGSRNLGDRFSFLDPAAALGAPAGFPLRQILPALPIDGPRALAHIENQIESFTGTLWDGAPTFGGFSMALGWVNEFAPYFDAELAKHAAMWTHLSSTKVEFNADGITLNAADITALQSFLARKEVRGRKILVRITNGADASIAHNIYSNPAESIQAMVNLFINSAPRLAGMALDIEGAAPADRPLASAWIAQLRAARDAQLAGRTVLAAVPAKTSDSPSDPWSGWCDYVVWGAQSDIMNPLTYGYSDGSAPAAPGPSSPWPWMHDVMSYASSTTPQSKLMFSMCFYGTRRSFSGGAWSSPSFEAFYDSLRIAHTFNARWFWDAANREWYWQNDAITEKGYQPTPQAIAERLSEFYSLGYRNFSIWAIGQSDSLFYPAAETTQAVAPLLKMPQGSGQSVNDPDGSSSIGRFSAEVLESSRESFASVLRQVQLHGKKARLRMGYAGITTPQFPAFETLEVDRVEVNDDQTGWRLQLVDPKRALKSRIFTAATKEAPVELRGNPMDLLLVVYQNHLGIGQNPNLSSSAWIPYDPATGAGLINPNRDLDVDPILAYRDGIFRNYYLEFSISEAQDGKQWIEREIYKVLGGYPVVDAAGRISPRFWLVPPLAGLSPVYSFTDQNLIEMPAAERAPIINQVTVRMDYDGSDFETVLTYVSGTSFSNYGLQGAQVVESRGLRSVRQGTMHAALYATKLFRRYDSLVPIWNIKAFHAALTVEVGDLVALTHAKVLDPATNQRGVANVLCEVLEKQPDYQRGTVRFRLLDVRYLAGHYAYRIAHPGNVLDWTRAPFWQQHAFMFIASDSSGLMSDGAAGNPIYG